MNSNLQAEEAIKVELIYEVPLENKTQVVATEQVFVQLITLKISQSYDLTSSVMQMDQFTAMRSGFLFNSWVI